MLTMRDRADIEGEYTRAVTKLQTQLDAYEYTVMTAVRDTYAWVLGYTDVAPWTERVMPNPGADAVFSEWAKAETVNHNSALIRDEPNRFTYGSTVEHALDWARGGDTNAPTQLGWG